MAMTLDLLVHVSGGSVALIAGAVGLISKKGSLLHRQAGKLFVLSMFIMAITGASIAYFTSVYISVLAGSLSLYLVLSAWITGIRRSAKTRYYEASIFSFGLLVLSLGLYLSWRAYHGVTDILPEYTIPAGVYYVFTLFVLLGVIGDIIVLIKGGASGKYRIARHLWRMCIPLYIAAGSLFDGQRDIFPAALQDSFYLEIPAYLVFLTMLFWLAKLWIPSKYTFSVEKSPIGLKL